MKASNENAFEAYISEALLNKSGWVAGDVDLWDKERALFPAYVASFLKDSQPKLWAQMASQHGDAFEEKLVSTLCKELAAKGTLHVLRHGFKFYGKTFRMAFFKPAHGLNQETLDSYAKNQLIVVRQVPCNPGGNDTVDMVLALNGLPVATCELKNPGTSGTFRAAIKQYKDTRLPQYPLFKFKQRALVHFAIDPNEIHMTTRLSKHKTFFLPFNRGSHPGQVKCGKGNPQHPSGHRTGYFWEEVLQRDSFLDILGHFMFLEKSEKVENSPPSPRLRRAATDSAERRTVLKETMIFPRYHQLDAVRKLVAAARAEGPGHNYLIQHSAGSGKTNSISWLSHRLASLHTEDDKKVYDCVVVITDRTVLDRQLQDAIYQIEHKQGVVRPIDQDSKQLAEALVDGTKIVVTTLQKFPFVLRGLLHVAGADELENPDEESKAQAKEWEDQIAARNYAIIVDEAHSSQTGETARELKAILGQSGESSETLSKAEGVSRSDAFPPSQGSSGVAPDEMDFEDHLNRVMESRGRQKNLSFFAFTATPKGKTLSLFGSPAPTGQAGPPKAFHTYSMRQAIEEGFILDVVKNYTTYKTFYKLVQSAANDPKLPKKKAVRKLAKFMTLHPHNVEQRVEIIVEHFRNNVKREINGRAKAMIVTPSRLHAVRYTLALRRYLEENRYNEIRALVAFSGTVKDPDTGEEYTEPGMNTDIVTGKSISETQLRDKFDTSDYQILLVANKYQTGFDQPLLYAMYVDKRLDGVQAVQTLSRLNRCHPGKQEPFVLDFVNDPEEIYKAFKPYYDVTTLEEEPDPQQLETLKHELNQTQVYHWSEVEAFGKIFYKPAAKQNTQDNARLQKHVQPAVDRYQGLEEDEQREEFRGKLKAFVRLYSFLSQVIPYSDPELELLYGYGRFLLPYLPRPGSGPMIHPEDDVQLELYRQSKVWEGQIDLNDGDIIEIKPPTEVGTGQKDDEDAPLSEIIDVLNERFGTEFSEEDRLFFEQIKEKAIQNEQVIETARANNVQKFSLGIRSILDSMFIQRIAENDDLVTRCLDNEDIHQKIQEILSNQIYQTLMNRFENEPLLYPEDAFEKEKKIAEDEESE